MTHAPVASLSAAIDALVGDPSAPAEAFDARRSVLDRVIARCASADHDARRDALERLLPGLAAADPYRGGMCAMAVGVLLEAGAPPSVAFGPMRAALVRVFGLAEGFLRVAAAAAPGPTAAAPGEAPVIEPRVAWLGGHHVEGAPLQALARLDPLGARAWSRLDDWFLPTMALARFDDAVRAELRGDLALREAARRLFAADPSLVLGHGLGNSAGGGFVARLLADGSLPRFG